MLGYVLYRKPLVLTWFGSRGIGKCQKLGDINEWHADINFVLQ